MSFRLRGVRGCRRRDEKGKLGLLVLNRYTELYYTVCLCCNFYAYEVQNFYLNGKDEPNICMWLMPESRGQVLALEEVNGINITPSMTNLSSNSSVACISVDIKNFHLSRPVIPIPLPLLGLDEIVPYSLVMEATKEGKNLHRSYQARVCIRTRT